MNESAKASLPFWQNWSGNIKHVAPTHGASYYFTPTNLTELKAVLAEAKPHGVTVRASGQRHSQPPLVVGDNRNHPPLKPTCYLVDMSCYVDVGANGIDWGPATIRSP
jgi:hypothetical protein